MSNCYTRFCGQLTNLSRDEEGWLKIRYQDGPNDREDEEFSFNLDFEAHCVYFSSEESGRPDHVAEIVVEFLRKFRPKDVFTMTYACYGDRIDLDGIGGGAICVTQYGWDIMDAHSWAENRAAGLADALRGKEAKRDVGRKENL